MSQDATGAGRRRPYRYRYFPGQRGGHHCPGHSSPLPRAGRLNVVRFRNRRTTRHPSRNSTSGRGANGTNNDLQHSSPIRRRVATNPRANNLLRETMTGGYGRGLFCTKSPRGLFRNRHFYQSYFPLFNAHAQFHFPRQRTRRGGSHRRRLRRASSPVPHLPPNTKEGHHTRSMKPSQNSSSPRAVRPTRITTNGVRHRVIIRYDVRTSDPGSVESHPRTRNPR